MSENTVLESAMEPLPKKPHGAERIAWFHCFAGIAGDMALGSLLDAGADLGSVMDLLNRLELPGWSLHVEEVMRGGLIASRVKVKVEEDATARTHRDIAALIKQAGLPERVEHRSLRVFESLARIEARLHNEHIDEIHFHELGGHDAIIDIVGTIAALEVLEVDRLTASPVATGLGMVETSHGPLPNPSPAVVSLLLQVPTYGRETSTELTTPTGAAFLATLAVSFGPMPAMKILGSGFGAGKADLESLPNCTQVVIGDRDPFESNRTGLTQEQGQPAIIVETNLDDVTGEELSLALERLLDVGVYDAWITPVLMKKGRPGHVVHALADISAFDRIQAIFSASTGTLGVRVLRVERWPVARTIETVKLDDEEIRMKVSKNRVKPEFEDVGRISSTSGLSPREVSSRAEEAWRHGPSLHGYDRYG